MLAGKSDGVEERAEDIRDFFMLDGDDKLRLGKEKRHLVAIDKNELLERKSVLGNG